MVQSNAGQTKKTLKQRLYNWIDKHSDQVVIALDHIIKFLAVVNWIWMAAVLILAVSNIFFLHKVDLGFWQFMAVVYIFWYRGERKKNDKLEEELHMHKHAVGNLVNILQKMTGGSANVTIEQISPMPRQEKKKDKLVN